ncbi:MAG: RNA polymerase factor sigma-32 [Pseudomonadota bacterium]
MPEHQAGHLSAYLKRIDRYRLLSPKNELELARRWRDEKDRRAAEQLVLSNLRFVVKIALEYRSYGIKLLDLVQEGNLGLLVAVSRFDPERKNRLTTYAVWWIRAFIQEHIRRQWSLVRFGTTRAEQRCFYRLRRERQRLERAGEMADPDLLAAAIGVGVDELRAIEFRIARRDQSLDDPAYADAGETKGDRLADEAANPEGEIIARDMARARTSRVRRALAKLDPRERTIIERRYLGDKGVTLKELGRAFGISRERIRQLEARAKQKMRAELADVWEAAA